MKWGYNLLLFLFPLLLNVAAPFCCADVLDNWTTNQITTNLFGLKQVVYGGGRYVAMGEYLDSGGIYSSEDGFHWTLRATHIEGWGLDMSYTGGRFVGICPFGVVATSTNGIDWTLGYLPSSLLNYGRFDGGITYANGLFVIANSTNGLGNIATSTNAISWQKKSFYPAPAGPLASIAYGAGSFVALGCNDGYEYTSSDGRSPWYRSTIPGGSKIYYCNGLFIVPFDAQTNLLSTNGRSWASVATGLTNQLGKVTFSSGLFMGCAGNYITTSVDGTNWFQYLKPLPSVSHNTYPQRSVATDGSRLVTVDAVYSVVPYYQNGFVFTSDVLVEVSLQNAMPPQILLSGLVGRTYQIQSADVLPAAPSTWVTNVTVQLTNTTFVWTDLIATNAQRFYRGVLLP